jgi:hypothetical protein
MDSADLIPEDQAVGDAAFDDVDMNDGTNSITRAVPSAEDVSGAVNNELGHDVAALEAANDAAADASLRIYLVRQDADAAAMIDEARAAGDALFATKMKEHIKVDAANTLLEDAAVDSMRSDSALPHQLSGSSTANVSNELSSAAITSDVPIETEAVPAEGCPEPWESNPKFSPCRKFMAEFCTLHGTDPRSRC